MAEESDGINWSLTTWEGSRREQLRRWSQLTFDEILEAQEEMAELAEDFAGAAFQSRDRERAPASEIVRKEPG